MTVGTLVDELIAWMFASTQIGDYVIPNFMFLIIGILILALMWSQGGSQELADEEEEEQDYPFEES